MGESETELEKIALLLDIDLIGPDISRIKREHEARPIISEWRAKQIVNIRLAYATYKNKETVDSISFIFETKYNQFNEALNLRFHPD